MPDAQDTLIDEFQQIAGAIADSDEAWGVGGGGEGGVQRDTAPRGNVDSLGDQTGSIDRGSSNSTASSSSGGTLNKVSNVVGSDMGLLSIGLKLASYFEGGPSTPPPLTNYAMPDSATFTGSTDDSGAMSSADFDQMGQPRSYGSPSVPAGKAPAAQSGQAGGGGPAQPVQITVQALDAQSIMDRSDDIANAVNKAILSLHPIADTISNL